MCPKGDEGLAPKIFSQPRKRFRSPQSLAQLTPRCKWGYGCCHTLGLFAREGDGHLLPFPQLLLNLFLLSRSLNAYVFPFSIHQLFDQFIHPPLPGLLDTKHTKYSTLGRPSWIRPTACSPRAHGPGRRPPRAWQSRTASCERCCDKSADRASKHTEQTSPWQVRHYLQ